MNMISKIAVTALALAFLAGCGQGLEASSGVSSQGLLSSPIGFSLFQNPPSAKGTDVAIEELVLGAHDRYANLEVSYFTAKGSLASGWVAFKAGVSVKAKGRFSGKGQWVQTTQGMVFYAEGWVVFEPNNEPLWAQIVSR